MSDPGSGISRRLQALRPRHLPFDLRSPEWPRRLGWRWRRVGAFLRDSLERELQERAGIRWLAVAFGAGSAAYFALPEEPLLWALVLATLAPAAVALIGYRRGGTWRVAAMVAVVLCGATAAKLRVESLVAPQVGRELTASLTGRVVDRESRVGLRPRITLDRIRTDAIPAAETPPLLRLTLATRYGLPPLGAEVTLRARLAPVGGPVVPGGYDPHRAAFFERIGGSGFALGGWTVVAPPAGTDFDLAVARIRAAIVERILATLPGERGAIAAALLVGERSGISEETNDSLRISGLAHILSISGLHMMLIAGTAFFVVRALLALSPGLALRFPIRKWAAAAALVIVTLYLLLSGGGAATVRSYVMAAIVFGAILLDRPAISMRNLAISAFVVVGLTPESVVEPGFQMSFLAVAALIAAWEFWRDHRMPSLVDPDVLPGYRLLRKLGAIVAGTAITTLVAGLATAPFAAYHFERLASYSLLGNLLAAPLVSAIIMPFGLLALVALPFGLEAAPLTVMAFGIDMLLDVSRWVASLPGAQVRAPAIAPLSLILVVAGMLWLCLWRLRWRLLGVPFIAAGIALVPLLLDPPDLLVAPDGKAVAVRDPGGVLRVSGARAGSYQVEQFFDEEGAPPQDGAVLKLGVACDALGCILPARDGRDVSHVIDPAAFAEDCRTSEIVVTPLAAPADCAAPLVIDGPKLRQYGAHAVRIGGDEAAPAYRVVTERRMTARPWQGTSAD